MERYEIQRIEVNGKQVVSYSRRFTEDERADLKSALIGFPKEKVDLFINGLEVICVCARHYLSERNVTFHRTERKRMLGRFEKAEAELYKLIDKHRDSKQDVPLRGKKNLFDYSIFSDDAMILEKEKLHYLVLAAATQLKEIMSIIKDESGTPGRPAHDAASGELVKIIAHAFQNHFDERPTGHLSKSSASPFYDVVQIALEACGLPSDYPDRHIRAALKTL